MASSTFTKFNSFWADLGLAKINLSTDTIKVVLTDVAPVATNTVLGNLTQIAATGGYTTGGLAVTVTSWSQTAGVARWILVDKVITATGAALPQHRYYALYSDTSATDALIGWYDFGSEVNIPDTLTLTIDFDGVNGVFSLP